MQQLQLIGYTQDGQPVYAIFGGAPEGEGEGDEGEAGDGGEDEGADEGEKGEEYTPPTKEQWALMQTKLKRANGEAASRRRWLEENGINPKNGEKFEEFADDEEDPKPRPTAKKGAGTGSEDHSEALQISQKELSDLKKLRQREGATAARREANLVKALSKSAVKGALVEAGWNGQGANLITKMIDLGDIEIDDDGDIIGLSEQIAEVKADMPDWFKKKRASAPNGSRRRPENESGGASDVDGADKGTRPVKKEPTGWLEQLSAQLDAQ